MNRKGVSPANRSKPATTAATEPAADSPSMKWTLGVPLLVLAAGAGLGLGVRRLGGRR
jgi:hypothetical protein